MSTTNVSPCVIIPAFNHLDGLRSTLADVLQHAFPVIVVDDASTDGTAVFLEAISQSSNAVAVVTRDENGGKGAAIVDGLHAAAEAGFSHAIALDADGQHDADILERASRIISEHPRSLILGVPEFDESVPLERRLFREVSNVLAWIQTLSRSPRDVLCGFRIYPVDILTKLVIPFVHERRMGFDIEVVVRLCWAGIPVHNTPLKVRYPSDGVSHFRYLHDNLEIARLHVRLVLGMLLRAPKLLWRRMHYGGSR